MGTFEASLASYEKDIATWLRWEKVFGNQIPQSHSSLSLFFVNCQNATTRNAFSLNHLVLFWRRDISDVFLHFSRIADAKLCTIHWSPYHGTSAKLAQ